MGENNNNPIWNILMLALVKKNIYSGIYFNETLQ